jgi:small subunit ribosomal protein S8
MSCSDPIGDMLTIIRNGVAAGKSAVRFPHSQIKADICQVLLDEGYILGFDRMDTKPAAQIQVRLKYGPNGECVINRIQRISKPGCRVYRRRTQLRPIINGYGISILSTSKGVLSDRVCRATNIGGEVICQVK